MKKWNEMDTKKKNTLEIILCILIIVTYLVLKGISTYDKVKEETRISDEITLVTDNSRYFTVLNCAEKYIVAVASNNKENILTLLNSEYKNEMGINESNIKNYIPKLDTNIPYDYVGKEMYTKSISKNVTEYYIKGKIKSAITDEESTYIDYDLTVILYENKLTFSIRPGVNI